MKPLEPKIDFAVGGQAVIEGVMMRSPNFYTVTVRNEAGDLKMKQVAFASITERFKILKWPMLRGIVHLVESMMIGYRSLNYSNAIFVGEDVDVKELDEEPKTVRAAIMNAVWMVLGALYVLGTLAFTLFLLKLVPLWVAEQISQIWPFVDQHYWAFNLIDGITKISIFLGYILLISLIKDIWRVFQYHGAEHKSIWAYEKGLELTVENARAQTRFHPRCGTSFIFLVILMSVMVYTVLPSPELFWTKLGIRILVIPLIAALSYELLKVSAKFQNQLWMRWIIWPGLWIQRLTTKEPDDSQLEVALHSLKASLQAEKIPVA